MAIYKFFEIVNVFIVANTQQINEDFFKKTRN